MVKKSDSQPEPARMTLAEAITSYSITTAKSKGVPLACVLSSTITGCFLAAQAISEGEDASSLIKKLNKFCDESGFTRHSSTDPAYQEKLREFRDRDRK